MQENKTKLKTLIDRALSGDQKALEALCLSVQDTIFNLALRMLGTIHDAEDASQDILIRVMTNLSSFRMESSFSTWVYRIATNYLIDYKKSMFANAPLDFDFYSNDVKAGFIENTDELLAGTDAEELALELKLSCTNVMLQCFDPKTRCIFILGTMFRIDSRIAAEILDMTPENYRQKLSRARKKMAEFLSHHCGLTETGFCRCQDRIGYAVKNKRLNPQKKEYTQLKLCDRNTLMACKKEMDTLEELAEVFFDLPAYHSPVSEKDFMLKLYQSPQMKAIQGF